MTLGSTIKSSTNKTFSDCEELCIEEKNCMSLVYDTARKICILKDKKLNHCESISKNHPTYISAFKTCRNGMSFP